MKHHVLALSRYSRMGASSRLRTMQYETWLHREGLSVEYAPLFDDSYLKSMYAGKVSKRAVLSYYQERLAVLRRKPRPDLIWMEYEALPWLPWLCENLALPRSVPVVSDFDDAIFHRYDRHNMRLTRGLLSGKIASLMRYSDLVTAGNPYIAKYAQNAGAKQVEIVPTVVDLNRYHTRPQSGSVGHGRVGWIGTPNTWREYGKALHLDLSDLLSSRSAKFCAIGAGAKPTSSGTLEIIPWNEETEDSEIQAMDIGVMPLPDTPWARGKCGYKLLQYMACGLPVIASPVGVNKDIVEHGVNGFLAETQEDWHRAIKTLLDNDDLRHKMGSAGRQKVEQGYSLQVWGPAVAKLLDRVIKNVQ